MHLKPRSALAGIMISAAALAWPLALNAQQTAPSTAPAPKKEDETLTLSPFTINTEKDKGWGATNSISGSRVNTAIKDIPIPITVITSEFIDDIGATDLRQSLSYMAGITLQSQNDLGNSGAAFGSVYGPGGVNNPEGVTSNINQVQMKIRGFITNNTLRDGFYRGNSTDSVNIERIEVVSGPNALLYGTGNFGGVVDYLTKQPLDVQQSSATFSYGTNNFMRATIDTTGPLNESKSLSYRITGAVEDTDTHIDHQSADHYFIAPTLVWKPTATTRISVEGEYGKANTNGFSFRALRAAQGNSSTPINNDQLEAVSFYWPPGADKRTFNLGGSDNFVDEQQSNLEIKATQLFLRETDWLPEINGLIAYNRSTWDTQTRNLTGQITGPISPGQPGYALSQTITTLGAENGLGGQTVSNGNLLFGTLPNSVTKYNWNTGDGRTVRDQERVELTLRKSLFADKWYQLEDQVLAGYSEVKNDISSSSTVTIPGGFSYKSPNDLTPIVYGKQGDGSPDPAMYTNNRDNINLGWNQAYYVNNFLKFGKFWGAKDRIILMNGIRRDKNNKWSTNTTIDSPTATPNTIVARADEVGITSKQNGIMLKLTDEISVYGVKSEGYQPNFGTQHDAITGAPAGADTAKSEEIGVKFDLFKGKLTGMISHYKVTKTAWTGAPWYAPTPLGHIRFNPNKPIVYNLQGGFNAQGVAGATLVSGASNTSQGAPVQTDPNVIAKWNAAVAAGAITHLSPITNQAFDGSSIYINASNAAGAAYLDAAFASVFTNGGAWPGWLYQGNSIGGTDLANINNATLDAGGFQNGVESPAYQTIDQAKGWDVTLLYTPNDSLQLMLTASIDTSVKRISSGVYPKYPYPQDRWAVWYFPNGGFGLQGSTLAEAYTDPADTSTHKQNLFPGDDTPRTSVRALAKYKFNREGWLKGLSVGLGAIWTGERVVFSGITHGGGQAQYNGAGQLLVLKTDTQLLINGFATYDWKGRNGWDQYVQVNVDNMLNDRDLYGLIYQSPIAVKVSYGIKF